MLLRLEFDYSYLFLFFLAGDSVIWFYMWLLPIIQLILYVILYGVVMIS